MEIVRLFKAYNQAIASEMMENIKIAEGSSVFGFFAEMTARNF